MKIVRRYLFTFLCLILALVSIFGWWRSSREWVAWDAETPYGIIQIHSESSLLAAGVQFMRHEHSWAVFRNADPTWDDQMTWPARMPQFGIGDGLYSVTIPYWQLMLSCLGLAGICLWTERSRFLKKLRRIKPS